jgi:hypothetical protein
MSTCKGNEIVRRILCNLNPSYDVRERERERLAYKGKINIFSIANQ